MTRSSGAMKLHGLSVDVDVWAVLEAQPVESGVLRATNGHQLPCTSLNCQCNKSNLRGASRAQVRLSQHKPNCSAKIAN